ncbi:MAG: hypothetical protein EXR63_05020 [Dehalococcoidia bacterium]|nr:hypothetical protein [Dehalococcoidia bacterium]
MTLGQLVFALATASALYSVLFNFGFALFFRIEVLLGIDDPRIGLSHTQRYFPLYSSILAFIVCAALLAASLNASRRGAAEPRD